MSYAFSKIVSRCADLRITYWTIFFYQIAGIKKFRNDQKVGKESSSRGNSFSWRRIGRTWLKIGGFFCFANFSTGEASSSIFLNLSFSDFKLCISSSLTSKFRFNSWKNSNFSKTLKTHVNLVGVLVTKSSPLRRQFIPFYLQLSFLVIQFFYSVFFSLASPSGTKLDQKYAKNKKIHFYSGWKWSFFIWKAEWLNRSKSAVLLPLKSRKRTRQKLCEIDSFRWSPILGIAIIEAMTTTTTTMTTTKPTKTTIIYDR